MITDFEYSKEPEGGYEYVATVTRDGETVDITKHVAMMYDLIDVMDDACSGWCDAEDLQRLADIAEFCGFEVPDCREVNRTHRAIYICQAGIVGHNGPHSTIVYRGVSSDGNQAEAQRIEW